MLRTLIIVAVLVSPAGTQQRPDPVPHIGHSCPVGYQRSNGYSCATTIKVSA
jgi:hypothetical protein